MRSGPWRVVPLYPDEGNELLGSFLHQSREISDGLIAELLVPQKAIANGPNFFIVHVHVPELIIDFLHHR